MLVGGLLFLALAWALSTPTVPATSAFSIDVAEIRDKATELSGALPTHINVIEVADAAKPLVSAIGGFAIGWHRMPWTSFQIVSTAGTILVDVPSFDVASPASGAALRRAVSGATRIVFTHEHPDHIGGLNPLLALAAPAAVQVSDLQAAAIEGVDARLPNDQIALIAPGVVSIPAPGHTPGSRIIAVLTRSGHLFVLAGDIAWHRLHYEEPRSHPRISSFVLGEDSEAIGHQLRALHDLSNSGSVTVVSSHDGPLLRELTTHGALHSGFE